jgi:Domain of unknown function (DUF4388)
MARRVTTTVDSLVTIIQTLSNGGMSGHLIAQRRNATGSSDEGEIFFVHGGIIEAKAAYRRGVDALIWMSTWEDCTFSFRPSKESEHIPVLSPDLLNPATKRNTTDLNYIPSIRKIVREKSKKKTEDTEALMVPPNPLSPDVIPSRTEAYDKALQLLKIAEYSRIHHHIFLLVDGHRSVGELIRLTGRRKDDVVKILRDLEKLHIIRIPN